MSVQSPEKTETKIEPCGFNGLHLPHDHPQGACPGRGWR